MIWILAALVLAAALSGVFLIHIKQLKQRKKIYSDRIIGPADGILILLLSVIFAIICLYGLGSREAPETVCNIAENPVKLEFTTPIFIEGLWLYPYLNEINGRSDIIIGYTSDGIYAERRISDYNVFTWRYASVGKYVSDITVYTDCGTLTLGEFGVIGTDGLVEIGSDFELFDEQELIPERADYMNSAYFDEIFHARTAYEYINDIPAYEWTHPPLGKAIISLGVRIFGMNPFGWRFMGAVFGCAMIAAVYIFAKNIFRHTAAAFFAALLMKFDFMHFVQSRIGTVDVFLAFFMLMMYLFMYRFARKCVEADGENGFVPWIELFWSAVFFGLAVSVKWSAAYGIIGLLAIGLAAVFGRNYPAPKEAKGRHIAAAAGMFIIIPASIYVLSYIPFISSDGTTGMTAIIGNQIDILTYHGKSVAALDHEFASRWYTWPFSLKPVQYYRVLYSTDIRAGISAFGNPAVWFCGFSAFLISLYTAVRYKEKNSAFLCAAYCSSWLPWMFIARDTFLYHYYPCTAFLALMTANVIAALYRKKRKTAVCVSAAAAVSAILLFCIYRPVLTGTPISSDFADTYLNLFKTWYLI